MESRRSKEGGLLCRHERLDALLLVHRFTEQPAQAKRRIRQGGHLAFRDQPLVGLTDRGQEVPTGGLATLATIACARQKTLEQSHQVVAVDGPDRLRTEGGVHVPG